MGLNMSETKDTRPDRRNLMLALGAPFLVATPLVAWMKVTDPVFPNLMVIVILGISTTVGFRFGRRVSRSLLFALIYFPVIALAVFAFSAWLVLQLFGDNP